MSRTAQAKDEDGIQFLGSNNKSLKKLYKQEVKIPMDERLYSVNGDYVFDVREAPKTDAGFRTVYLTPKARTTTNWGILSQPRQPYHPSSA